MPVENASSHHTYSDPTINVSLGHDIVTKENEIEISLDSLLVKYSTQLDS